MDSKQLGFKPLNATLYNALNERFGPVAVANEGCAMQTRAVPDGLSLKSRGRVEVVSAGEYYRIRCPYCRDLRQRLWINHCFAQPDRDGWPMLWLAHCYNEDCLDNEDRRKDLEIKIFGTRTPAQRSLGCNIQPGTRESEHLTKATLPGHCIPVDKLPPSHPAFQYLVAERQHDLPYLAAAFNISVCVEAKPEYRMVNNRIVIPIYQDGVLRGWQARKVGENPHDMGPKYFGMPGMPKRLLLYNSDNARRWPFVVIVEGATSVWRIGGPAVALLGKTMTPRQSTIIKEAWANKPVFVILDPDARDEMDAVIADLSQDDRVMVIPIYLPDNTDPDNFDHATNVAMLQAHAQQRGITLPTW